MAKPRLLNMNGRVIPYEDARVHVLSTAMKYAASVYEAMRAYWSDADQQLYVFRLREHLRRLQRSAKIARIPLPADLARLEHETLEIIRANELREDLHVRLIVFVDTDDGGLASREPVGYVIAPIPTARYFDDGRPPRGGELVAPHRRQRDPARGSRRRPTTRTAGWRCCRRRPTATTTRSCSTRTAASRRGPATRSSSSPRTSR